MAHTGGRHDCEPKRPNHAWQRLRNGGGHLRIEVTVERPGLRAILKQILGKQRDRERERERKSKTHYRLLP